ncbi:MAG: MFS transporter, partial [Thermodesulfobacteriota bacterium]
LSPSYALGFGLMGIVLPIIVKNYNWRWGWILLGIAGILLIAINFLLLRDDPEKMGLLPWGETSKMEFVSSIHEKSIHTMNILRKRAFWVISISYLLISIGVYIISDFLVTYGVMELKVPYPTASGFITLMAVTSIAGGFILMTVSDFLGRIKTLIFTHLLLMASILFIIFSKGNIGWLRLSVGCFGFFYGPIFPLYAACARDYFEKEVAGTVIGLFTIFYGVGAMLGPILGGYLSDLTHTFRWSYGLGAFCAWMSALVITALRNPSSIEKRD